MNSQLRGSAWLTLFAATLWTSLWALGFPPPNWDDLFFIGGAVELAEQGNLANPLIRFWHPVAAERYFFQPPFYQYALAGWFNVFGVGSASVRAFQCLAGAVASVAAGLLLRRRGFSGAWTVPILWAFAMSSLGLRHDALGLALLAGGLLLLDRAGAAAGIGAFLLSSSVATWPILIAYALPLGGVLAAQTWRRTPPRHRLAWAAGIVSGALAAIALFIASIGTRLPTFLSDFSWHARLRRVPIAKIPSEIQHQITNGHAEILYLPLYMLFCLLAAVLIVRWKRIRLEAKVLFGALSVGMLANLLLYVSTMHMLLDLACWIAVVALITEVLLSRTARRLCVAAALSAFSLSQSYLAIGLLTKKRTSPAQYSLARQAVPPDRLVGVDEVAARFVFDYRLPPNAFFWNYSVPPPQTWPPSTAAKAPGTVWVLSPAKSEVTDGMAPASRVRLLGRTFGSIPARPYDVIVLK